MKRLFDYLILDNDPYLLFILGSSIFFLFYLPIVGFVYEAIEEWREKRGELQSS